MTQGRAELTADAPAPQAAVALVVDVDGALLRSDLLLETLWAALGRNALATLVVVLRWLFAPARLKRALLGIATPEIALLPVRDEVLALARAALAEGRPVMLASGADAALVTALARRLGLPERCLGSDGRRNLTGRRKAAALVAEFGAGGFDYIGNAAADLAIWRVARRAIAVAPGRWLAARLRRLGKPVETVGAHWHPASLLTEMRPYQWVKNLLLLLPILSTHGQSERGLLPVLVMLAAFCAVTSALYLVNDMLDLAADRRHPEKRHRPIAAGALPIGVAMTASLGLGLLALAIAAALGPREAGLLLLYAAVSLSYSLRLKHLLWVDLGVLAALYTLRVYTGAVAAGISVAHWLLPFSFAIFLCLTVVKRLTDLARMTGEGTLPGRRYARRHMDGLTAIAIGASLAAIAIYLPYTFSPAAAVLYSHLLLLRLAAVPMLLWLWRMIRLSRRGEEDYDPIIFVAHDATGLTIMALGLGMILSAI